MAQREISDEEEEVPVQDILIVDGYNILHAWPEFTALVAEELGHARDQLLNVLSQYGASQGVKVIVVFDAHNVKGNSERVEISSGIETVFTREGETADMWIEKTVGKLKTAGRRIFVATSDAAEQRLILSKGGLRISAAELRQDVLAAKRDFQKMAELPAQNRSLDGQLGETVLGKLETLRKARNSAKN